MHEILTWRKVKSRKIGPLFYMANARAISATEIFKSDNAKTILSHLPSYYLHHVPLLRKIEITRIIILLA